MSEKKGIAILGSTGSIGTQALEVIESYPDYFDLQVLTANKNADLLIEQARKHQPNSVVLVDHKDYKKVKDAEINSNYVMSNGMLIGCHHGLDSKSLNYIIKNFEKFIKNI